jgi:hypothetical protein
MAANPDNFILQNVQDLESIEGSTVQDTDYTLVLVNEVPKRFSISALALRLASEILQGNIDVQGLFTFEGGVNYENVAPTYEAGILGDARSNLDVYSTTETDTEISTAISANNTSFLADLADATGVAPGAGLIGFDNTSSNVTASTVQAAIFELDADLSSTSTTLTQLITTNATNLASADDGNGSGLVGFFNTGTNISTSTVQGALTELDSDLTNVSTTFASAADGDGASLVGFFSTNTRLSSPTVQGALVEVDTLFEDVAVEVSGLDAAIALGTGLRDNFSVSGREFGQWRKDDSDMSSSLVVKSIVNPTVNTGSDIVTVTDQGIGTGDVLVSTTTAGGFTAETKYYAREESTGFALYTSFQGAVDGTAGQLVQLVDEDFTLHLLADSVGAAYLVTTGMSLTGSDGAWVRTDLDSLTPYHFRATGDGVTDDLQALRAYSRFIYTLSDRRGIAGARGRLVYGDYYASDTVNGHIPATDQVVFDGQGRGLTRIFCDDPSVNIVYFRGEKDKSTPITHCGITNTTIECTAQDCDLNGGGGSVIWAYHINDLIIENCEITGGYYGIRATRVANPAHIIAPYFNKGLRKSGGRGSIFFDSDSTFGVDNPPLTEKNDRTNTTVHIVALEHAQGTVTKHAVDSVASDLITTADHGMMDLQRLFVYTADASTTEFEAVYAKVVSTDTYRIYRDRADAVAENNEITGITTSLVLLEATVEAGYLFKSADGVFTSFAHIQGAAWAVKFAPDDVGANDKIFSVRWGQFYSDNGGFGVGFFGTASDGYRIIDFGLGECQDTKYGFYFATTTTIERCNINDMEIRNIDHTGLLCANSNQDRCSLNNPLFDTCNAGGYADGGEVTLDGSEWVIEMPRRVENTSSQGHALKTNATLGAAYINAPGFGSTSRSAPWDLNASHSAYFEFNVRNDRYVTLALDANGVLDARFFRNIIVESNTGTTDDLVAIENLPFVGTCRIKAASGERITVLSNQTQTDTTTEIQLDHDAQIVLDDDATALVVERLSDAVYEVSRSWRAFESTRPQEATVSSGEIDAISSRIEITAESAGVDDVDTINNLPIGGIVYLRANPGNVITVKDSTGNIRLNNGTDFVMDTRRDAIALERQADGNIYELFRNTPTVIAASSFTITAGASPAFSPNVNAPIPGYDISAEAGTTDDVFFLDGTNVEDGQLVRFRAASGDTITFNHGSTSGGDTFTDDLDGVDGGLERLTFNGHSITTGDGLTCPITAFGLTAGTTYYANVASANQITVHATRAQAVAGSSAINLTGQVDRPTFTFYPYENIVLSGGGTFDVAEDDCIIFEKRSGTAQSIFYEVSRSG